LKKILFISLAVVLALSVGLIGCEGEGPVAPTEILVGLARDTNGGPLGVFECGYGGVVYRWFTNKVNDAGGIYLSDYDTSVDIELVIRDFDVLTWDIGDVTEALIETDNVDFIWGGPGTDCIFTQAPIANLAGKLLITLEGGASSMIADGDIDNWPYVWVTLSFSDWYQIPVLHDLLAAEVGTPTAYITYIGDLGATHGIEYRDETLEVFGAGNVTDAGFHSYDLFATAPEATAIIAAAEAAYNATPYDIFCAYTYPWNVAALTLALMASDFNPPAILFGPGGNANSYASAAGFGPYSEGIMSFIVADNYTSTAISDMYTELAAQAEADWVDSGVLCTQGDYVTGWDTLDYWGQPCYAAGLEIWKMAVEDAGNLDSLDVRDALAAYTSGSPATTVLGDTWFEVFGGGFGGGILSYECHPGEIGQWIGGEYRTVGGNDPTATFVYPNTGNWFWLND
jgi:hypothetical protein